MKYLAQSMLQLFRHTKIWCRCCEPSKQHRHSHSSGTKSLYDDDLIDDLIDEMSQVSKS
jgi:hypothetical protein